MPLLVRKAGDHPRVCGENKAEDFLINRKAGSPPRVRRKPLRNNLKRPKTRITPACAGKTENGVECVMFDTDHPRVCGENHAEGLRRKPGFGSPPRVRGKRRWDSTRDTEQRITPACAGKTDQTEGVGRDRPDHPRVCGENRQLRYLSDPCKGSPPRMRGKRSTFPYKKTVAGITPAHAGKTLSSRHLCREHRDHPRACGENRRHKPENRSYLGSPPRMRGKPVLPFYVVRLTGITPAHAGKTTRTSARLSPSGDHPRACGENRLSTDSRICWTGSPPRMRGKPAGIDTAPSVTGITPAHAGKTITTSGHYGLVRDHPRACGENGRYILKICVMTGSPPRMRGKHLLVFQRNV